MRITSKGQVTIPAEIRERLGLLPNSEVTFEVTGDSVRIRKVKDTQRRGRDLIARIRGKASTRMSTDEILALTRRRSPMTANLEDSNVILDVVTEDPQWDRWSAETLGRCAED